MPWMSSTDQQDISRSIHGLTSACRRRLPASAPLPLPAAPEGRALSRQDKLGVSCRVKVPVG